MSAAAARELVLASSNQGKLRELRALLEPRGFTVCSAAELGFTEDVPETGETFAANAEIKARAVAAALNRPALADDSGLAVDALDGAPGVLSARWAGENASDAQRSAKLLAALEGVPQEKRGAAFVCVMACAKPTGEIIFAEGRLAGRIAPAPAGDNGFGYDPVFELPDRGCTVAQIPAAEKNAISHRGRALATLAAKLEAFLGE